MGTGHQYTAVMSFSPDSSADSSLAENARHSGHQLAPNQSSRTLGEAAVVAPSVSTSASNENFMSV